MQQPSHQYSSYPQHQEWQSQRETPPTYIPVVKPPSERKGYKRLWIILAMVLLSLLVILSVVACESGGGSQSDTTTTVSQATQPAAQPTHAAQPTTAPTHPINSANAGPAILGAPIV